MTNTKLLTSSFKPGNKLDKSIILNHLKSEPELYEQYLCLSQPLQEEFLGYCTGNRGIKITYDVFFKYIFNPESAPERLSSFISCLLGKSVHVKYALPLEGGQIIEEGSLVVMDIIVELDDGSLANVEIQKLPYLFPGERSACYSSDLILRQYSSVKNQRKKNFNYGELKTVYTIVILEKSTSDFRLLPNDYIHHSKQVFDTGLKLNLLQEYLYIPLDIYSKNAHTIDTEVDAWLLFLTSDDPNMIMKIIKKFPSFIPLYNDIFEFRQNIREVLNMFSEALREMDRNTVQYMIEQQQEVIEQQQEEISIVRNTLDKKEAEIKSLQQQLKSIQQ